MEQVLNTLDTIWRIGVDKDAEMPRMIAQNVPTATPQDDRRDLFRNTLDVFRFEFEKILVGHNVVGWRKGYLRIGKHGSTVQTVPERAYPLVPIFQVHFGQMQLLGDLLEDLTVNERNA